MRFLSRRNRKSVAPSGNLLRPSNYGLQPRYLTEELEIRRLLAADLTLSIAGTPIPTVNAGSNITYTVSVRNTGNDFAQNVTLTDAIPANTTFLSITQSGGPGYTISAPPVGGTGTITATVGQLNSNVATTFTIRVLVPSGVPVGTVITDTATVGYTGNGTDPNLSDNTGSTTTTVNTQADIQVSKTGPTGQVIAGTDVTYSFTITNAGPSDAINAVVSDIIPTYLTFVSFVQNPSTPAVNATLGTLPPVGQTGTLSASIPALHVGETASFTTVLHLSASAPDAAVLFNTVTGSSDTFDPAFSNNFQTVSNVIDTQADIEIFSDSDKINNTIEGTYFPYTFTIYNKGPSDAQGVSFAWNTPNFPGAYPAINRVFYRTGGGGPAVVLVSGPAFAVTLPPVPPEPRGVITGALTTLPSGVATTYQFWVGTPENQDLVQNSSGGSATTDPDNTNNTHTDNLHVYDAPLIVQTVPDIQGNAGQASSVEVMTFTDTNAWPGNIVTPNYTTPSGRYGEITDFVNSSINWGDGTVTTAVISVDQDGTYHVTGTHIYTTAGTYGVHTLVTSDGESTAVGDAVAVIGNPVRSVAGVQGLIFNRGVPTTKKLATFFKGSLVSSSVTYTQSINWGDGVTDPTTALGVGTSGSTNINGTHTYSATGTYNATVTVRGSDGIVNTAVVPITVIDTGVTINPIDITATTGITTTAKIATFVGPTANYTAVIDFGDGTATATYTSTTTPAITNVAGVYSVFLKHSWAVAGTYSVKITISSTSGTYTANATATVTDPPVTPGVTNAAGINVIASSGIPALSVTVATFKDSPPDVTGASYSAVIDWGDFTPTTIATISYDSTTQTFSAKATHTWATAGIYTITTTITHGNSAPVIVTSTATVTDQLITSRTSRTFTGIEGKSLSNVLVGSFTVSNPLLTARDFTATINWNDGTAATAGTIIRLAAGSFQVTGTHTYKDDGSYKPTITVFSGSSAVATIVSTVTLADAALSGISKVVNLRKNVAFTGIVASFTDGNPYDIASTARPHGEYSVSILWGDNTASSTGIANYNTTTKNWDIVGTHTYKAASPSGGYKLTISVKDGTSSVKITSTIIVT